jgi:hypothetical protein
MKSVIGGLIAIILGIFFFTLFFPKFLNFLAGIIPLFLIIGGGLILYLKHGEEATDTWDKNNVTEGDSPTAPPQTSPAATKPVETELVETEPVETEPVETEPVEKPANKPTVNDLQFFGNTDSLVFHRPECRYSKNKRCNAVFSTRENAIQEGYKACGACKP